MSCRSLHCEATDIKFEARPPLHNMSRTERKVRGDTAISLATTHRAAHSRAFRHPVLTPILLGLNKIDPHTPLSLLSHPDPTNVEEISSGAAAFVYTKGESKEVSSQRGQKEGKAKRERGGEGMKKLGGLKDSTLTKWQTRINSCTIRWWRPRPALNMAPACARSRRDAE